MEYFYFNKNKFIGQDKLLEYNNYCISKWKLEEKDNNLYDYIIDKYRNEFDNPKSKFRLKVIDNRIFSYSNDTIDNIISYSFEKIISIDDLNNYQVIEKTLKKFNRNKLLFLIGNDGFIFCCSHLFIDWLSNRNLCCIISVPTTSPTRIPSITPTTFSPTRVPTAEPTGERTGEQE